MNWEAIGAIGQAVSALALVFVLLQVRHAREEMRRSLNQGRAETVRQLHLTRASNSDLAGLRIKAEAALGLETNQFASELINRAGLTRSDAQRLFSEQMAWWSYRAEISPHLDDLPPGARFEIDWTIRYMYGDNGNPLSRLWYETTKRALSPDAVRYIDDLLAQPG